MMETRMGRAQAFASLILVFAIGGTTVLWAQGQGLPATSLAASPAPAAEAEAASAVRVLVGRSTLVDVGAPITRVSLTSADVADAMVTTANQLLINGKAPGTISMFVWARGNGALRRYEVTVSRDLSGLAGQLKSLFPSESIEVQSNGKHVVLSGTVSSKDMIEKAVNVATGYVDKRDEVVTLLQLRQDAPSNQVLLRVRFAEVSRNALTELGASYFSSGYQDTLGRIGTEQFGNSLPNFEDGKLVFSDFLNVFFLNTEHNLGAVIKALQTKGMFQSLAEPNLVSESGKEASFLAGGEIPIPVAQGSGANLTVAVTFKEFGIRLTFTPTVNGERVHLKVKPEVSTLDFGNAVILSGFRIPALNTRRTETELELQNRQTFAIAGLMNNSVSNTMQKIPGIGDIPILGTLFKSKAAQKNQTELVVMITPEILPNNSRGVTGSLPRTPEPYLGPLPKTLDAPAPAFTPDRPTSISAPNKSGKTVSAAPAPVVAAPSGPAPKASTVQPAPMPAPDTAASRPVSPAEAKKAEQEREKAAKAAKEESKRAAIQAAKDRERAQKEAREQAKRDQEQAKRDAEAAKKAAAKQQASLRTAPVNSDQPASK
jgi:pilus assembly protein CpaC